MEFRTMSFVRLLVLGMMVVALCVSLGCGAKEKADTQTTTTEKSTTLGKAVDEAKEAAGEAVTLANPKPGIDPVCGMQIDDHSLVAEVNGMKYGFCSEACAEAFKADPAKYLTAGAVPEGEMHDN